MQRPIRLCSALAITLIAFAPGCAEKSADRAPPAPTPRTDATPAPPQTQTPAPPPAPPSTPRPLEAATAVGERTPDPEPIERVEMPSGLIIEDLRLGNGATCWPNSLVTIHFRASLAEDGKVFDATYDRGEPETHPLSRTMPGLRDGLVGMRVGGRRRLTIPAEMAFGTMGRMDRQGNVIVPPGAPVIWDVELVDLPARMPERPPTVPPATPSAPEAPAQP